MEAALESARLSGYDLEPAREAIEAVIRYAETGERQTVSEPQDWIPVDLAMWYSHVGQSERALDGIEAALESGTREGA